MHNLSFKKYYEKNKDKRIKCECGNSYTIFSKSIHFKSKTHKLFLIFEALQQTQTQATENTDASSALPPKTKIKILEDDDV